MPKKIVFAWNYLEWGGAQMYFLGLARRLKERCDVLFVFPEGTDPQFAGFCAEFGIPFVTVPMRADLAPAAGLLRKASRHFNKIRAEFALVRAVRRAAGRGSAVHVELSPWQSATALAALTLRGPVFVTMHNRLPDVARWRRALWRAKFRLVGSRPGFWMFPSNEDARESLLPFVPDALRERTPVTYTNVNPDEVAAAFRDGADRRAERERFGIAADAVLVLTVGQFIDRKGRWVLLEAAKKLADAGSPVEFAWIANNEPTAAELDRIRSYGLGGRFRLIRSSDVGRTHLELMRFLRAGDVFALPSFVEGLPISLLEAMAMGLPAVSTRVNAIPEAIEDRETGLLVEAGDAEGLAAAIGELAGDASMRRRLAAAGRRRVLERFSEDEVAETAWKAYRAAFGEGSR